MKILKYILGLSIILFLSCSDDDDSKDIDKPTISLINPVNCVIIKKGEPFTFKATLSDNVALGSYSINMHNNFDHHSHSTEVEECELQPKKEAKNAYLMTQNFNIDGNPTTYSAENTFTIDKKYDSGNYHFMVKVVDAQGWATNKGISVIVE